MSNDGGMASASGKVPEVLIIGLTRGEWPIAAFESDVHAAHWVGKDPGRRRLWRVRVEVLAELQYVAPSEPRLKDLDSEPATTD